MEPTAVPAGAERPQPPGLVGWHHVRIPVSDVLVSRDWYVDVLGFQPMLIIEEEDRVAGVILEHPSGVVMGLHDDPRRAAPLRGFMVVALSVSDVGEWLDHLDRRGVPHGPLEDHHLGRGCRVPDPDGILVQLQTLDQPSADEA